MFSADFLGLWVKTKNIRFCTKMYKKPTYEQEDSI